MLNRRFTIFFNQRLLIFIKSFVIHIRTIKLFVECVLLFVRQIMIFSNKTEDDFLFTNIVSLRLDELYWMIKVKVIHKYEIQRWDDVNENSKFFKFIVMDNSGSIQITVFGKLVDKFFTKVEVFF